MIVAYIPPPKVLPGFPNARRAKPKTPISGDGNKLRKRWVEDDGTIYEWDYQHGRVEKYNSKGRHLGEFDADGNWIKDADPGKKVEP